MHNRHLLPLLLLLTSGTAIVPLARGDVVVVSGGPERDYQASIIEPWGEPDRRMAVFERLSGPTNTGDLWATHSEDGGETWSEPVAVVSTAANERHPSLVQTGVKEYALFYLKDEGGNSFRIYRAHSQDGLAFVEQGPVQLGWASAGEINPWVIRHEDGTLSMTYHRLGGAAYLSRSEDDGVTWDTDTTMISSGNAALPRLAYRESDGLYLAVYQTNPGNNLLRMWVRTTTDPTDWSGPEHSLAGDGNNHDPLPVVLSDDSFAVFWARVSNGHFQIFSARSDDGAEWSSRIQHTLRPDRANVQPYALPAPGQGAELYWGAAQDANGSVYDIWRQIIDFDGLFADRFAQ